MYDDDSGEIKKKKGRLNREEREFIENLIREGKPYIDVKNLVKEKFDRNLDGSTYRRIRDEIIPDDVDNAITKVIKGATKPVEKKRPKWTPKKQKEADNELMAGFFNKAIYAVLPAHCKKNISREKVDEINVGGGIVGLIYYYFPGTNVNHPAVILIIRFAMLIMLIYEGCIMVKERITSLTDNTISTGGTGGIKPEWKKFAKDYKEDL